MSKPQIFLSSTCYDLTSTRAQLNSFLSDYGFEVLDSQSSSFGVSPKRHSHSACLDQVENSDYLVLIVGKRRGGNFIGSEKSITNEEYNLASTLGIPIVVFLDKEVSSHRQSYKKNPSGDFSHIVEDVRIFNFIDYVSSGHEDNWLHPYENVTDIQEILKTQFAYYLKLYSASLRKKDNKKAKDDLQLVEYPSNIEKLSEIESDQDELTVLRNGLLSLHSILKSVLISDTNSDFKKEKLKCLWVMGKYGSYDDERFSLSNDVFKGYAWSTSKGKRVFKQLNEFGVQGYYDEDFDSEGDPFVGVFVSFNDEDEDTAIAYALYTYIHQLLENYENDEAFELFKKADMRIFMT